MGKKRKREKESDLYCLRGGGGSRHVGGGPQPGTQRRGYKKTIRAKPDSLYFFKWVKRVIHHGNDIWDSSMGPKKSDVGLVDKTQGDLKKKKNGFRQHINKKKRGLTRGRKFHRYRESGQKIRNPWTKPLRVGPRTKLEEVNGKNSQTNSLPGLEKRVVPKVHHLYGGALPGEGTSSKGVGKREKEVRQNFTRASRGADLCAGNTRPGSKKGRGPPNKAAGGTLKRPTEENLRVQDHPGGEGEKEQEKERRSTLKTSWQGDSQLGESRASSRKNQNEKGPLTFFL